MARWIDYAQGDTALRGYFAEAAGQDPRPGVLIAPAWLGISESIRDRVERVADMGYAAFALDLFGEPVDIAARPSPFIRMLLANPRLLRDRLWAGLRTLGEQPGVDPSRLAAMGYCFGGLAALELARDKAPLLGVVSFHGVLDTESPAARGDVQGKVLVLTGDADPVVPFEKVAAFRNEMRAADVDFEINLYSGAKHSFTGEGSLGPDLTPDAVLNPQAEARSWLRMTEFLREIF